MKTRVILFSAAMATMMAACGGKTAPEATGQDSTVNDSSNVAVAEEAPVPLELKTFKTAKENKYATVTYAVEVPTNNEAIANAIWKHFCEAAQNSDAGVTPYKGDYSDGNKILGYYVKGVLAGLTAMSMDDVEARREVMEEGDEEPTPMQFEETLEVNKIYEKGNYVVFISRGYSFAGGAHGIGGYTTLTFDKKNGVEVKEIISKKNAKTLQKEMRKGLCKYFECKDSELNENLMDVKGSIPWPSGQPYLTADGVCFHYGAYEIAPYMAGEPEFIIPYSKLEGMLLVQP